ncbi:MAG: nuclear transport factor 2 family protein [Terriglobales bacterium]
MRTAIAVVLAFCLAAAGCTLWKEKPVSEWSQATGGEHLERLFWKDLQAREWARLEDHMSATYVFQTPRGSLDRAGTLEHMKKLHLTDYSLGDFQIQPSGHDMIVTYTAVVRGTFDGQPLSATPIRMMTVWQRAKKGWMAIAHMDVASQQVSGGQVTGDR